MLPHKYPHFCQCEFRVHSHAHLIFHQFHHLKGIDTGKYTLLLKWANEICWEENSKATNVEHSHVLPIISFVVVNQTTKPVASAPIEPNACSHGSHYYETQGLKPELVKLTVLNLMLQNLIQLDPAPLNMTQALYLILPTQNSYIQMPQ